MAARFWVGGSGTWDNTSTTNWSTTSGGASGAAAPTSADAVTFDGNSGASAVITVNATVTAASVALGTTGGAFTGTLDFATNNNSPTFGTFAFSGSGTRTLNLGSGTFTLTATTGSVLDVSTVTGLTLNAGTSTFVLSATPSGTRNINLGVKTFNNITINNSAMSPLLIDFAGSSGFTCNNLTFTNVQSVRSPSGITITVSGTLTWDGNSSNQGNWFTNSGAATISVANANTLSWLSVQNITKSGVGSITVNNGFNGGGNTSVTINAPAGGATKVGISPGFS